MSTLTIGKYVTKENKGKLVKLRGLPFNVTEDEILGFFNNYNVVHSSPTSRNVATSLLRKTMGSQQGMRWCF